MRKSAFVSIALLLYVGVGGMTALRSEDKPKTILSGSMLVHPYQALEKPLGYYPKPFGWRELPLGYSKYPPGYRELPMGYSQHIPNALDTPRGYSKMPPRFIEKDKHPQVNTNTSLRITTKSSSETAISGDFKNEPPGYKKIGE